MPNIRGSFKVENPSRSMELRLGSFGDSNFSKDRSSYRPGIFDGVSFSGTHRPEIYLTDREFHFDLSGRVKRIHNHSGDWRRAWAYLERMPDNRWVSYTLAEGETFHQIGNKCHLANGWSDPPGIGKAYPEKEVEEGLAIYDEMIEFAREVLERRPALEFSPFYGIRVPNEERDLRHAFEFLEKIAPRDRQWLEEDSKGLPEILGAKVPVLPPETLEIDYRVIPIMLMEGCGNNCSFCNVKGAHGLSFRSQENVEQQIQSLRDYYGPELKNFDAVMLGQNNAFAASADMIEKAARLSYEAFGFENSYLRTGNGRLYLFSTLKSFLEADESKLELFDSLPYGGTRINVGIEAATDKNLRTLGKPQDSAMVEEGLRKAAKINAKTRNWDLVFKGKARLKVSVNFIIGDVFDEEHIPSIGRALKKSKFNEGDIFLSPLQDHIDHAQIVSDLAAVKGNWSESEGPRVHLYTMQAL